MTVAVTPPIKIYDENGSTITFAVPFQFIASSDLVVTRIDPTGPRIVATLGTDYSVAGGNFAAGSITMVAAKPAGWEIEIKRRTPVTQPTDYTPGDDFPAETHEKALDRGIMIAQELAADLSRAILAPPGETPGMLPAAAVRASKYFFWDAEGDPTASPGTGSNAVGGVTVEIVGNSQLRFTVTGTDGVARTGTIDLVAPESKLFRRTIFGWNQRAGLGGYRFVAFEQLSDTIGVIAYSARNSLTNDDEIGYRLESVTYTIDIAAKTLTLGTPVVIATPPQYATAGGAYWCGGLLRLPSGRLLLAATFLNSPDGTYFHADSRNDIVLYYSDDGGASWTSAGTILAGETAHTQFGLADQNAAQAGFHLVGGVNNFVRLSTGRISLTGYLYPGHYLATLYTDNADGITGWSRGAPLAYPSSSYNEPSVALLENNELVAVVRYEAGNARGIFRSTSGGAAWTFDHLAADTPIRNVASPAAGEGKRLITGGATSASDNRLDWDAFVSEDKGLTFPQRVTRLFERKQRIGYGTLKRIAPGYWGLAYENSSNQAPGSFNQKPSIHMAVFNDALLTQALPTATPDSAVYNAATEYAAYAAYVTGDGGTIQDAAAAQAAITAAIAGNYYSKIKLAVSAKWGHKGLGTATQTLYSLNRIKNSASGAANPVELDVTLGYATAKFPAAAANSYLDFANLALRAGDILGCVLIDKAADTDVTKGIGVQWTDGTLHYFWPLGVAVAAEDVLRNNPGFVTDNLKVYHFALDWEAQEGLAGYDGDWKYATAYFQKTLAKDEQHTVKIASVGGVNRLLGELWLLGAAGTTYEHVRLCGLDVGARY